MSRFERMLAEELGKHWKEAQDKSGYSPGVVTRKDDSLEVFYEHIEESTGLTEQRLIGLFNDWNRLSHSEAEAIQNRTEASVPFCGYVAEQISKVVGAAGTSTCYIGEPDGTET